MMLRFWLRRNIFRRGLRWLRERTWNELLSRFFLPSLLPRLQQTTPAASVVRDGRELHVVSSKPISVEESYVDWVAPLMKLPKDATSAEWKAAIEKLVGDNATGPLHFPARVYLDSVKRFREFDVEFVHRCRVSRLVPPLQPPESSVILIYNRKENR